MVESDLSHLLERLTSSPYEYERGQSQRGAMNPRKSERTKVRQSETEYMKKYESVGNIQVPGASTAMIELH